jgi:uncharacterized membrane protein YbhN (UPF0104 family)
VVGLAIIGFAVRVLIRNWEAVDRTPIEWRVSVLPVAGSLLLVLATYALLVESWRRMVAGWGTELRWWVAARVWVLSSMGKYLPLKVWAIAGMALLGRNAGVPTWVATASAIVLQVVSIGTGALVVAITGAASLESAFPGAWLALVGLVGVAAVSLGLVLWPAPLNWLLRRFGGEAAIRPPTWQSIGLGVGANAAAWVLYGLALFLLARGVFADVRLSVPAAVAAFTASYLAGFLFLLAPGGLGVREMVFVLLTQSSLGPAQALALAAVSRVGMTLADLLAAAPFVVNRGRFRGGS